MELLKLAMLFVIAVTFSFFGTPIPYDEPHAIGDDDECTSDWECVEQCLNKLPENRSESECDI